MTPKNFALMGASGFVAPKHMKAIRDTGNDLVAALDKHDSVGVIDSYAPDAAFFTEVERFDRHLEKQRRSDTGTPIDYVSICTPNYLHDAHCRLAMRVGADAICEKPLVVNPWNIDQLDELQQEFGRKVYSVLQLRLHPAVQDLKKRISESNHHHHVELTYVTRRGRWYDHSWKGEESRSGGLAMNIGVHFFDFLLWVFGDVQESVVHLAQPRRVAGSLELERASINWFLSIEEEDLPQQIRESGGYAYRSIACDHKEIDLSAGFTDLHTMVYQEVLAGNGFGIDDARAAIQLISEIRGSDSETPGPHSHPFVSGLNTLREAA